MLGMLTVRHLGPQIRHFRQLHMDVTECVRTRSSIQNNGTKGRKDYETANNVTSV